MDHLIGLVRGDDLVCTCTSLDAQCLTCRRSWLWQDGTRMLEYDGWESSVEPGASSCAVLQRNGWMDKSCVGPNMYLCELFQGRASSVLVCESNLSLSYQDPPIIFSNS